MLHSSFLDTVYQLSPAGSTTVALLMPEGHNGSLVGYPVHQASAGLASTTTTGSKVAIIGKLPRRGQDRRPAWDAAHVVPDLFGGSQRPTGQSGLFAWASWSRSRTRSATSR